MLNRNLGTGLINQIDLSEFNHYNYDTIINILNILQRKNLLTENNVKSCNKKTLSIFLDIRLLNLITPILNKNLFEFILSHPYSYLLSGVLQAAKSPDVADLLQLLMNNKIINYEQLLYIKELIEYDISPIEMIKYFIYNPDKETYFNLYKKLVTFETTTFNFYQVHVRLHQDEELIDALNDIGTNQLFNYFRSISHHIDLKKIKKMISIEKQYDIALTLPDIAYEENNFNFLIRTIKLLDQKQLLKSNTIYYMARSMKNLKKFTYFIFKKIISISPEIANEGLQLFEVIKDHPMFIHDSFVSWINTHKHKSSIEIHATFIYFIFEIYKNKLSTSYLSSSPFSDLLNNTFSDHKNMCHHIYGNSGLSQIFDDFFYAHQYINALFDDEKKIINYFKFYLAYYESRNKNYIFYNRNNLQDFFSDKNAEQKFLKKYDRLLDCSPRQYQKPFKILFSDKYDAFMFLKEFFHTKSYQMLYKLLNTSLIDLNKFLKSIGRIDSHIKTHFLLPYFFYNTKNIHFNSPLILKELFNYIDVLSEISIREINTFNNYQFTYIMSDIILLLKKANTDEKKILARFQELFFDFFCKELNLPIEELNKNIFNAKQINDLLLARKKYRNDNYIGILDELLKCYYLNHSINNFIHKTNQNNPVGKRIAINNLLIREELIHRKININMLYHYPFAWKLCVSEKNIKTCIEIIDSIWKTINCLSEKMQNLSDKQLIRIKKNLNNFIAQINKKIDKKNRVDFIKNTANMSLLNKIILPSLRKMQYMINLDGISFSEWRIIQELSFFLINDIENLNNLIKSTNSKHPAKHQKLQQFTIKIWEKNNPNSFFLGNHLGCCLATNGEQFPAIIQRIIDDAMIIITVIDDHSGDPIAGMWTYIAKEVSNPNICHLVANFTEMRASIAKYNLSLSNIILSTMLDFADTFANAWGVDLILAPLTYGSLPNWQFEKKTFYLKKIGAMTVGNGYEKYYLSSLHSNCFFTYDKKKSIEIYPTRENLVTDVKIIAVNNDNEKKLNLSSQYRLFKSHSEKNIQIQYPEIKQNNCSLSSRL